MKTLYFLANSNTGCILSDMYSHKEDLISENGEPLEGEEIVKFKETEDDFEKYWEYRKK